MSDFENIWKKRNPLTYKDKLGNDVFLRDRFDMPLFLGQKVVVCGMLPKRKNIEEAYETYRTLHVCHIVEHEENSRHIIVEDLVTKERYEVIGRDCCYYDEEFDSGLLSTANEYRKVDGCYIDDSNLEASELVYLLE